MPRFYFDTQSPTGLQSDETGSDFQDAASAMADTEAAAKQLAADDIRANLPIRNSTIVVRDERGETVGKVKVAA